MRNYLLLESEEVERTRVAVFGVVTSQAIAIASFALLFRVPKPAIFARVANRLAAALLAVLDFAFFAFVRVFVQKEVLLANQTLFFRAMVAVFVTSLAFVLILIKADDTTHTSGLLFLLGAIVAVVHLRLAGLTLVVLKEEVRVAIVARILVLHRVTVRNLNLNTLVLLFVQEVTLFAEGADFLFVVAVGAVVGALFALARYQPISLFAEVAGQKLLFFDLIFLRRAVETFIDIAVLALD